MNTAAQNELVAGTSIVMGVLIFVWVTAFGIHLLPKELSWWKIPFVLTAIALAALIGAGVGFAAWHCGNRFITNLKRKQ